MNLIRLLLFVCLPLVALLAGCSKWWEPGLGGQLDYGVPPPPHDSTVQLIDFAYSPASPWHVGDEFLVTATVNHPPKNRYSAYLQFSIGTQLEIPLNDDGSPPDATAQDGVWSGGYSVYENFEPGANLPTLLRLIWDDGAPGQQLDGPPLTVLPNEEGG